MFNLNELRRIRKREGNKLQQWKQTLQDYHEYDMNLPHSDDVYLCYCNICMAARRAPYIKEAHIKIRLLEYNLEKIDVEIQRLKNANNQF